MKLLEDRRGKPMSWQRVPDAGWVWWDNDGRPTVVTDSVAVLVARKGLSKHLVTHGAPDAVRRRRHSHVARDVTQRMAKTGMGLEAFTDALDDVLYLESSEWPEGALNLIIHRPATLDAVLLSMNLLIPCDDPDILRAAKAQTRSAL